MMTKSKLLTHDQSEPQYGLVIGSVILTFVVLLGVIYFSMMFYTSTVSQNQDQKNRDYVRSQLPKFNALQTTELNRLQYRGNYIKLPIELAKKAVILKYSQ
jgi:5-bromo-4-chloroindolyl phosphate hydrolysis protein